MEVALLPVEVSPLRLADEEVLYRAARASQIAVSGGRTVISANVFADRTEQISVDRANLQDHDPRPTLARLPAAVGVVSITAGEARNAAPIVHVFRDSKGRAQVEESGAEKTARSEIEVSADPLPDNPAHALIYGTPEFEHKKMFKLLCERLTLQAKIEISPPGLQTSE